MSEVTKVDTRNEFNRMIAAAIDTWPSVLLGAVAAYLIWSI